MKVLEISRVNREDPKDPLGCSTIQVIYTLEWRGYTIRLSREWPPPEGYLSGRLKILNAPKGFREHFEILQKAL